MIKDLNVVCSEKVYDIEYLVIRTLFCLEYETASWITKPHYSHEVYTVCVSSDLLGVIIRTFLLQWQPLMVLPEHTNFFYKGSL